MRGEARIECHDPSSVGKARALLHARAGRKARARIPPRLRPERRRSEPFGQIDRADDLAIPGDRVDRKSVVEGKSVSVRVDLGGRRFIKKTIIPVLSTTHTTRTDNTYTVY